MDVYGCIRHHAQNVLLQGSTVCRRWQHRNLAPPAAPIWQQRARHPPRVSRARSPTRAGQASEYPGPACRPPDRLRPCWSFFNRTRHTSHLAPRSHLTFLGLEVCRTRLLRSHIDAQSPFAAPPNRYPTSPVSRCFRPKTGLATTTPQHLVATGVGFSGQRRRGSDLSPSPSVLPSDISNLPQPDTTDPSPSTSCGMAQSLPLLR
jgi:hypothetical protein